MPSPDMPEPLADLAVWRRPALTISAAARVSGMPETRIASLGDTVLDFAGWRTGKGVPRRLSPESCYLLHVLHAVRHSVPTAVVAGLVDPVQWYAAKSWSDPSFRDLPCFLAGYPLEGSRDWQWSFVVDGRWPEAASPGPVVTQIAVRVLLVECSRRLGELGALEGDPPAGLAVPPPRAEAPIASAVH